MQCYWSFLIYIHFDTFILLLGPPNPENLPEDGKLKSEMMSKDNKRYYLDLKENQRGRFLRVKLALRTHLTQWTILFLHIGQVHF